MKLTIVIIIFIAFIESALRAQNLVPNYSFETSNAIPTGYGQWYNCATWNDVNNFVGFAWPYASPDYLHTAAATLSGVQLPSTAFGTVNAHSGNAIMGFAAWLAGTPDYREYVAIAMSSPMTIGQTYDVSFYITNGTNNLNGSSCDHIAVNFSVSPLTQLTHEVINAAPQCDNTSQLWSPGWTQVTFTITPAVAYNYLTIGHFKSDVNTLHSYNGPGSDGAYYYIDDVVVQPQVILPVELTSFTGIKTDSGNLLQWETESEWNSDYFVIERSEDAITFYSAGIVPANAVPDVHSRYSFTDDSSFNTLFYYRLLMMDKDGSFSYSSVVSIPASAINFSASISINPFMESLIIHCESSSEAEVRLVVLNYMGNTVAQSDIHSLVGGREVVIGSGNWASGLYYVSLTSSGKTLFIPAIKR
ncbi:MAG: hypothetical protein IPG01_05960 [Chitinophagaceae bacterium]|nr:hypothetical protein [Chitinophagaceae bacterium]